MTAHDVEKFVIEQGNPETVILQADDWQQVYEVYRATNRDAQGVFVLVVNSRIYSNVPTEKTLDLSTKRVWPAAAPKVM